MTIKKCMVGLVFAAAATSSQAVTLLSAGFDDVSALSAAGWAQVNASTAPLGTPWFQGNTGVFGSFSGAANSYIAANFLGTGSAAGSVSNWLMTPAIALDSTGLVTFRVQTSGDGLLDKIEVRLSINGASTNLADFSTLLGSFQGSTLTGWVAQSYALTAVVVPATGRIAFRYVVDDVSTAGNYLGVDSVLITSAIPEPGTYALMALGVAGLLFRRRLST